MQVFVFYVHTPDARLRRTEYLLRCAVVFSDNYTASQKQYKNNTMTVCKRSLSWIYYDNYVHIAQPNVNSTPNCDISFANGELHQACGHSRDFADYHVAKIRSKRRNWVYILRLVV